jgi:hypothetical protein
MAFTYTSTALQRPSKYRWTILCNSNLVLWCCSVETKKFHRHNKWIRTHCYSKSRILKTLTRPVPLEVVNISTQPDRTPSAGRPLPRPSQHTISAMYTQCSTRSDFSKISCILMFLTSFKDSFLYAKRNIWQRKIWECSQSWRSIAWNDVFDLVSSLNNTYFCAVSCHKYWEVNEQWTIH